MAQYKVIKNFTDLQDKNHKYVAGDTYPRNGLTVSEERINELVERKGIMADALVDGKVAKNKEELVEYLIG